MAPEGGRGVRCGDHFFSNFIRFTLQPNTVTGTDAEFREKKMGRGQETEEK